MFIKNSYNFKINRLQISIKCILGNHINKNYLLSLSKSKYIINKNNDELWQKEYINRINKSKTKMLVGFFYKRKLIASSGLQNLNKKKISVGILIFDERFLNKKISHFFIGHACVFTHKFLKKKLFYAGFNKNNLKSIMTYEKIGFRTYFKRKEIIFKKTSITQIKSKL